MILKKIYFIFKRYGLFRSIHFMFHFRVLDFQIKKTLGNKMEKFKKINPGKLPEKYLNYSFWIFENLIRIFDLKLDKSKGLTILDIGCGPGYFIYIANYFGHQAEGLDLQSNEIYNFLIQELSLSRTTKEIKSFEELGLFKEKNFDLITAFMICFDCHGTEKSWNKADWRFFIDDLTNSYLKTNGKIILGLNPDFDLNNRAEVESFLEPWLYNC